MHLLNIGNSIHKPKSDEFQCFIYVITKVHTYNSLIYGVYCYFLSTITKSQYHTSLCFMGIPLSCARLLFYCCSTILPDIGNCACIWLMLTLQENCPAEAERIIEASFLKMSASFPDPLKAKDCFHKLNELKDCRIFSMLQEFLEKETTTDVQTTMVSLTFS